MDNKNLNDENSDESVVSKPDVPEVPPEKHVKKKLKLWQLCLIVFFSVYLISLPIIIAIRLISNVNIIGEDANKDIGDVFVFKSDEENDSDDDSGDDEIVDAEKIDADSIEWVSLKSHNNYNENIINILLLGDDQKTTDDGRGNTDSIMLISIDTENKKIKMISFLRDTYLQIPNHKDNKLNAAYLMGGADLIKSTLEQNFCISIDGIVVIHFDTFPAIIDTLGGVDVPLNQGEADFINTKTKHKYDDLTEGTQHLNGKQALWFSRIRKKSSDIFGEYDMGRTARQRYVINQIYKKYKDQDITSLLNTTNVILKYIQVDDQLLGNIPSIVKVAASFKLDELESIQCPAEGQYKFIDVIIGGDELEAVGVSEYMTEIRDTLHMEIYGDLNY